jgi:hypothetical protein
VLGVSAAARKCIKSAGLEMRGSTMYERSDRAQYPTPKPEEDGYVIIVKKTPPKKTQTTLHFQTGDFGAVSDRR